MIALLLASLALGAPPEGWEQALPEGDYRMVVDITTDSRLPLLGRSRVLTRTVSAASVQHDAQGAVLTYTPCSMDIAAAGPGKTTIPDAFVAAFPAQRVRVALTDDGDGFTFVADPGPICVGCEGGLPDRPEDASDWEGDGQPGATVQIRVPLFGQVDIYVAQYSHSVFVGRAAGGQVRGGLRFVTVEQLTLGASNRAFAASPRIEPVPEASGFTLTPAPPGCP